jgi:O-antigen/teichoic acid export membrane protein
LAAASFLYFVDLGIGSAVTHFIARSRSNDKASDPDVIASTAHAWALFVTVGAVTIFLWVAAAYADEAQGHLHSSDYGVLTLCGVILVATIAIRPMSSVLFGAGFFHIERRNQIIGVLIRIIGTLSVCLLSPSVVGVAVAETMAIAAPPILSVWSAVQLHLVRPSIRLVSFPELRRMFSYSMGAFSVSLAGAAILQFGTLVIGATGSASQVTYFNAAFRVYVSVRQIINWLTDPFRSVMSRLYVSERNRAREVLYNLLFVAFISSTFGCITLLIAMPNLLAMWLGPAVPLDEIAITCGILLTGLVLNAIHIPLIPASDAAGFPGAFFPHQLIWLTSYMTLAFILFPMMGIAGVAIAMTAPIPFLEVGYLLSARKTVNLNFEIWFKKVIQPSLPILILGLVAAAFTRVVNEGSWMIYLIAAFYGIVGVAIMFLTRERWGHQAVLASLRLES